MPRSLAVTNVCHVFYTPSFAPWRWDYEQLNPNNLKFAKLMDDYQNCPRDTLRWRVVANMAAREAPKAVMRERLRRRVREAFRVVLKQGGYDDRGGNLMQAAETPRRDLKGTLEMHCRTRVGLDLEFPVLVEHVRSIVGMVDENMPCTTRERPTGLGGEWWNLSTGPGSPLQSSS